MKHISFMGTVLIYAEVFQQSLAILIMSLRAICVNDFFEVSVICHCQVIKCKFHNIALGFLCLCGQ